MDYRLQRRSGDASQGINHHHPSRITGTQRVTTTGNCYLSFQNSQPGTCLRV